MKKLIFITILIANQISLPAQSSDEEQNVQKPASAYLDSGVSSFEILSGDNEQGYDYKIVETGYELVFADLGKTPGGLQHYFAKYITTSTSCTGCESTERNIKVGLYAFDTPRKAALEIDKNCDKIKLETQTYTTLIQGCCVAEDYLEIFDYKHKSIVRANNKVIVGSIPNSRIKMYVGYEQEKKDTSFLGTLYISYDSTEKYAVRIRSKENFDENCIPYFSPEVLIKTDAMGSEIFSETENEIEYTFWSLNKIENRDQINGLKIVLEYDCDEEFDISVIEIPIIEGKPFGKGIKIQEIDFK